MNSFVFDFDSTIVSVETLDEILSLAIAEVVNDEADRKVILREIDTITDLGMSGQIDLSESIARRLAIAKAHQRHIDAFVERLLSGSLITKGLSDLIGELQYARHTVCIVSGGLKICLDAVAPLIGIPGNLVFGNEYLLDASGYIRGIGSGNPLATTDGKSMIIKQLREDGTLPGQVIMIGDGMSDYKPYESGAADQFVGFGMHADREAVREKASMYVTDIDGLRRVLLQVSSE